MIAAVRPVARIRQQVASRVEATDAAESLQAGREMARAWSGRLEVRRRQPAAWSFIAEAVSAYVEASGTQVASGFEISPLAVALTYPLEVPAAELARSLGKTAAQLPIEEACYQLSACYTAMLPQEVRTAWGAYYTPPALTERLLQLTEEAGTDWGKVRVLDPACGGGAFLLPVALRMRAAWKGLTPREVIELFEERLQGFEIDPFAAWLTQVWLEIAFAAELRAAGRRFPTVVRICDSLEQAVAGKRFDLVIGNPPYGRVKLAPSQRERYQRSLYGHANLYGLFTDLAMRWSRVGGVIAYVTPTSFLAGEYFKALRGLMAKEAPPLAVDFVTARKGVFEDVLQETMLATYRRGGRPQEATVHYLAVNGKAEITHAGAFRVSATPSDPWLAPRKPTDQELVDRMQLMPHRLHDWGYQVSTGQLVWNRFKDQFRSRAGRDTLPVIWAEAITADGRFVYRAEKRNHQPYFRPEAVDNWLKVSEPCVLLQRTTAKEQTRRLIAAELPSSFIRTHGSVIVENHLNMVKPIGKKPSVSPAVVAAVLNSTIVDRVFRCISGSVAVSAFEMEAVPLPSPQRLGPIEDLVRRNAPRADIEAALERLYWGHGA